MNSLFRGSFSCGSPCGPDGRSSPRVVSHLPAPDPQRVSIPGPGKIFCCSFLDFGIPNHLVEISNTPPNKAWAQSFADIYPHYLPPQVESEAKELSAPQGHRQVFSLPLSQWRSSGSPSFTQGSGPWFQLLTHSCPLPSTTTLVLQSLFTSGASGFP